MTTQLQLQSTMLHCLFGKRCLLGCRVVSQTEMPDERRDSFSDDGNDAGHLIIPNAFVDTSMRRARAVLERVRLQRTQGHKA